MRSSQDDKSHDTPPLGDRYEVVAELVSREDARTYIARRRADGSSRRHDDGAEVLIAVFGKPRGGEGDALSLFAADAQLLRAEGHPALLPIVDAYWAAPEAFAIATPRVVAPTLAELLERGEKFSNFRIAAILRDLNGLLEWAREHKVVHRALSADTIFIEPGTDKVLALFEVRPLDRGEFPDADDDARTIGALARPMLAKAGDPRAPDHVPLMELRPDLPQRLVEAVEALALPRSEGGHPGDVRSFIAAIAMADAILAGEVEAAHMEAVMIEQQRVEREQWNAELEAHAVRIADLERKLADERAEMERTVAEERARLANERDELRASTEAEREELRSTSTAEREALLAQLATERDELHRTTETRRAELERAAEAERRALADERARTGQELARRKKETEELVAAQAAAMAAERAQMEHEIAARREQFDQELESLQAQLDTELAERDLQFEERLAARRAEQSAAEAAALATAQAAATAAAQEADASATSPIGTASGPASPIEPPSEPLFASDAMGAAGTQARTDADHRAAADARRIELEQRARDEAREVKRAAREARHRGAKVAAAGEREVTPAAVPVADSPMSRELATAAFGDDGSRPSRAPGHFLNPAFDPALHPVEGDPGEEPERDGGAVRWALPAAGIALVGVILTSALGIGGEHRGDRGRVTIDSAAGTIAPNRQFAPRSSATPSPAPAGDVAPAESALAPDSSPTRSSGDAERARAAAPRFGGGNERSTPARVARTGDATSRPANATRRDEPSTARPADSQPVSAEASQDSALAAALKSRADSARTYVGPQLPLTSPATRRTNNPVGPVIPAPTTTPAPTPPPRPDSQGSTPPPVR